MWFIVCVCVCVCVCVMCTCDFLILHNAVLNAACVVTRESSTQGWCVARVPLKRRSSLDPHMCSLPVCRQNYWPA